MTSTRAYQWIVGEDDWMADECDEKNFEGESVCENGDNFDLINAMKPTIKILIQMTIVCNIVLDIACYKYRFLAQTILHYESFVLLIWTMVPTKYNADLYGFNNVKDNFFACLVWYCDSGAQLITNVFCVNLNLFIVQFLYGQEITVFMLLGKIAVVMQYYLAVNAFALLITYIQDIHRRLTSTNEDNIKLLNGMHEGLLILSKNEQSPRVMFCNTPVKRIIDTYLAHHCTTPDLQLNQITTA